MIEILNETTSGQIAQRIVQLREEAGTHTFGRVLTLIVAVDSIEAIDHAIEVSEAASREHPCRVIVVVEGLSGADGQSMLNAQIRFGEDTGPSDIIILTPYGQAATDLDSLVAPLLLPDTPIVTFWPQEPPLSPADHPLGRLAMRRLTDTRQTQCPVESLRRLAQVYRPGDSDLAWSSVTLWRALLASIAQDFNALPTRILVTGHASHPSSFLIASWLEHQTGIEASWELDPAAETITGVHFYFDDKSVVSLTRETSQSVAYLERPGLDTAPVNLPRRSVHDCLMEELRRLQPDVFYERIIQDLISPEQS